VLNPSGDLLGDGAPGHAVHDGKLGAAWLRASTGEIVIVTASATGPTSVDTAVVSPALGTPTVLSADGGWLAVWQSADGTVSALPWTSDATGEPAPLLDGLLLGAIVVGGDGIIISHDRATNDLVVVRIPLGRALPIPVPINGLRVPLDSTLDLPSVCMSSDGDRGTLAWESGKGLASALAIDGAGFTGPLTVRSPSGASCTSMLRATSR